MSLLPAPSEFFANLAKISEQDLLKLIESFNQNIDAQTLIDFLDFILQENPSQDFGLELYDCAGTGGDGADTYNISTAAAFLAAKCGIKICKNGGRSSSSKVGSVDVLEALNYDFSFDPAVNLAKLQRENLSFFCNKALVEMLAKVKQVAKKHKQKSFISLLGPLASPVKLSGQLIGVGSKKWLELMKEVCIKLTAQGKRRRVMLVHSKFDQGQSLDEFSSLTKSVIYDISESGCRKFFLDPAEIALNFYANDLTALKGGENSAESAEIIRDILRAQDFNAQSQEKQIKISTLCLNTAALLYLANPEIALNQLDFQRLMKKYYQISLARLENWV